MHFCITAALLLFVLLGEGGAVLARIQYIFFACSGLFEMLKK